MKKIKYTILISFFAIINITKAQYITNPIFAGFYPDPSICKANGKYYLINSSFSYYPAIPIFESTDLLNWIQIGHAINRPEQINFDGAGVSRGLYAPDITFHKGVFYIVCTMVDKLGNFVITATNPSGPWSNPIPLPQINGIDPAIFFDNDDSAYIVYNSIPPNNIAVHNGHRTIRMNNFDYKNLKITSDNTIIVNGGTDMSKKPVWIEGPHIFKKNGWYYLICAEGGTGENHSEVVFRSPSLQQPFIPYNNNPILTQRHLKEDRKNPITSTGHADFVEDNNGNWWSVFLGCRPYFDNHYNTGRETFMAPVIWQNDWPIIDLQSETVKSQYQIDASINKKLQPFSGNYTFVDKLNKSNLNNRFVFLRTPSQNWCIPSKNGLKLQLQSTTVENKYNPSFVGFRQPHLIGTVETSVDFNANNDNEQAGLIVFQSENFYYYLCKKNVNNKPVIQLIKSKGNQGKENIILAQNNLLTQKKLYLKVEANNKSYNFYYATKKNNWKLLINNVDATFLSTKNAGGFVGCMYAMYTTSNGAATTNNAFYNYFKCTNSN